MQGLQRAGDVPQRLFPLLLVALAVIGFWVAILSMRQIRITLDPAAEPAADDTGAAGSPEATSAATGLPASGATGSR